MTSSVGEIESLLRKVAGIRMVGGQAQGEAIGRLVMLINKTLQTFGHRSIP